MYLNNEFMIFLINLFIHLFIAIIGKYMDMSHLLKKNNKKKTIVHELVFYIHASMCFCF